MASSVSCWQFPTLGGDCNADDAWHCIDFDCGSFFLGRGTGFLRRGGLGEESGIEFAEFRIFKDSFLVGGVGRVLSSSLVGDESAIMYIKASSNC